MPARSVGCIARQARRAARDTRRRSAARTPPSKRPHGHRDRRCVRLAYLPQRFAACCTC